MGSHTYCTIVFDFSGITLIGARNNCTEHFSLNSSIILNERQIKPCGVKYRNDVNLALTNS